MFSEESGFAQQQFATHWSRKQSYLEYIDLNSCTSEIATEVNHNLVCCDLQPCDANVFICFETENMTVTLHYFKRSKGILMFQSSVMLNVLMSYTVLMD